MLHCGLMVYCSIVTRGNAFGLIELEGDGQADGEGEVGRVIRQPDTGPNQQRDIRREGDGRPQHDAPIVEGGAGDFYAILVGAPVDLIHKGDVQRDPLAQGDVDSSEPLEAVPGVYVSEPGKVPLRIEEVGSPHIEHNRVARPDQRDTRADAVEAAAGRGLREAAYASAVVLSADLKGVLPRGE